MRLNRESSFSYVQRTTKIRYLNIINTQPSDFTYTDMGSPTI